MQLQKCFMAFFFYIKEHFTYYWKPLLKNGKKFSDFVID